MRTRQRGWIQFLLPLLGKIPLPSTGMIYLIMGIGLVVLVFFARMHWIQVGREEILRENVTIGIKIVTRIHEVVKEVEKVRVERVKQIEHVFHTIKEEVVHEVPVRAECNATRGWVRGHDYAAEGADRPKPRGLDDRADTGIDEARVLEVVAENYGKFHRTAANLEACRAAVRGITRVIAPD